MEDKKSATRGGPTQSVTVTTTEEPRVTPRPQRSEARSVEVSSRAPRTSREDARSTAKLGRARLTPKEEQIIRMRYGIAASPEHKLEFRGQENEETRVKLALIEQQALEAMRAARRGPSKKAKIIDKLTRL